MALNPASVAVAMEDVDWTAVSHAYGPATDIPKLLSLLESEKKYDRSDAIYEFYGNVCH
jgi:hypothetical protein